MVEKCQKLPLKVQILKCIPNLGTKLGNTRLVRDSMATITNFSWSSPGMREQPDRLSLFVCHKTDSQEMASMTSQLWALIRFLSSFTNKCFFSACDNGSLYKNPHLEMKECDLVRNLISGEVKVLSFSTN